jgi:hypothetical protein
MPGVGAAQFFYLLAISKINVAAAILQHYTGPVFVAFYRGNAQPAADAGRHARDRIDYRAAIERRI